MARKFGTRPSDYMGLQGEYLRFCFDEACAFLTTALEAGKELHFDSKKEVTHYSSLSEFYRSLGVEQK